MPKYHDIFDEIPDGITLHDPGSGEILDFNQEICDMLGYSRDEFADLAFEDIIVDEPPYTADRAAKYLQKAATAGPQTFEWRDQTKPGAALPVEVHLRQTLIEGQELILAVVRDISERKQRERELERKNKRLEEFARVVSHDLRNPLGVARGRLDLAREECDSDHLEHVARAQERMNVLIDDLLELARGGDEVGEREVVRLAELADTCWETIETADATFVVETDRAIKADRSRLQQLIENLIRNAIEHCGADVTITIGDLDDGFYVEDDGPGIPPDQQDSVFNPGFSTVRDGTGFGLSIVDQIVDGHDWSIQVTDGEADGARFEITGITVNE